MMLGNAALRRRRACLPSPLNCLPLDAADSGPVVGDGAGSYRAGSHSQSVGPSDSEPDGSSPGDGRRPSASS
eukprot:11687208-Alexandrium_andersonii.AAC.1